MWHQAQDAKRLTFTQGVTRYQHDPAFRQLVDVIQHSIETLQYTPSEVRDAAMVASILWEGRHTRTFFVKRKEIENV